MSTYTSSQQPAYFHSSSLPPYLTLPHLLSLTWLASPVLSLIFVAFSLSATSASVQAGVQDAKNALTASCNAAERAATVASSLPRFMAASTNKQITAAVNGTVEAARLTLIVSLTILQGIIEFVVDIYRSTFLCFLELVVRGGLAILIGAVQEVTNFIQNTLGGIRTSIQSDIAAANNVIASAVAGINNLIRFTGNQISVPQFSIPSLSALENVTLPNDFEQALVRLNQTLPTMDQLRDKVDALIAIPFNNLKQEINQTFAEIGRFDATPLPVPESSTVSFCATLDTSVVDDLGRDLLKTAKIGIILVVVTALLLIGGNCVLTWWRWRTLQRELENTREAWAADSARPDSQLPRLTEHTILVLLATASHPLLTGWANRVSRRFHMSPTQTNHLKFFFAYVFHPSALAVFLIGFFGILSVQIQLLAIGPIQRQYSGAVEGAVADFSNAIAGSLNETMKAQSSVYASAMNARITAVQDNMNNDVFGWVEQVTSSANQTLNEFYSEVQQAVQTAFGGTVLATPAQEFVRCILGTKVEAFENALTFLHDNIRVNMPRVPEDALLLSQDSMGEVTRTVSLAAVGSDSQNDDGGIVGRLVARYVDALKKQQFMFGVFLAFWGIVVLCALAIILWHSYGLVWLTAYRRRRWRRTVNRSIAEGNIPWRTDDRQETFQESAVDHEKMDSRPPFEPFPPPPTMPPMSPRARHSMPEFPRSVTQKSSWDSSGSEDQPSRQPIAKLKALGKSMFTREQGAQGGAEAAWLTRLKAPFARKAAEDDTHPLSPQAAPPAREDPATDVDDYYHRNDETEATKSVWSNSAGAQSSKSLPWSGTSSSSAQAKRPVISKPLALRPRPTPSTIPPRPVRRTTKDTLMPPQSTSYAPPQMNMPAPASLSVPTYQYVDRPGPSAPYPPASPPYNTSTDYGFLSRPNGSVSPPASHRRTSSVPSVRLLTPSTHTRSPSIGERSVLNPFATPKNPFATPLNPFTTPFDENFGPTEAGPSPRPSPKPSKPASPNPFSGGYTFANGTAY